MSFEKLRRNGAGTLYGKTMGARCFASLVVILLLVSLIPVNGADIRGKQVLMVIASSDFRDEEYFTPRQIFEKVGLKVKVASSVQRECKGMLGGKVVPDVLLSSAKIEDFAAVVFVGGLGAKEYWSSPEAHQILKKAKDGGLVIGAICIAPVTLAEAGLLKGRQATVYKSCKKQLEDRGAKFADKDVVVDGRVVTANGPEAAKEFGETIVSLLRKK